MWIQTKDYTINIDFVGYQKPYFTKKKHSIWCRNGNGFGTTPTILGEYNSKEEAMVELDKINNAIESGVKLYKMES